MKLDSFGKRLILLLNFYMFCAVGFSQNPTTSENYIYVQEATEPVPTILPTTNAIRTVQYFDGLGRPKQTVQVKASPDPQNPGSPKNLVTKFEYDGFGRQVLDFLPVPVGQNDGSITTEANYNTGKNQQYGTQPHFSQKTLESSPLNRVMKQAAPGTDWAVNSGHEIEFEYKTNNANEVWIYWQDTSGNIKKGAYSGVGNYYPAQSLYKTTTSDENGNDIYEYKDKQGRVVLKRNYVANGSVAGKNSNPGGELSVAADTYYAYDVYGNHVATIPPLAASKATITPAIQAQLCYTYKYDERNRMVEKTLPGKGVEYMVYDKQDRLVATQDANFRANGGKWLFTKYDKFGRVIYTGIYTGGSNLTTVQTAANNAGVNNESRNTTGFTQNGTAIKYTKTAFPTTFTDVLTVNYYDYYETTLGFTPSTFTQQTVRSGTQTADANNSLKGQLVTTLTRILGTDTWEKTHSVYDVRSRPVGSYKQNHLGGFTKTESKLSFRGLPEYTITDHKRTSTGIAISTRDNFTYDNMERLVKHTQSLNNTIVQNLISFNQYDRLGQLITKKVGGTATNATDRWQEVNYTYNIRGWLTDINNIGIVLMGKNSVPPSTGDDLFAFKIQYNQLVNGGSAITQPLYNGNIAQTFWKTTEDNIQRGYHYTYDQINRLRKADFYKQGNANITAYGEYFAYDVNGNIIALNRSMGDANDLEIDMDKLEYTYDGGNQNSNRLLKVVDNAATGKSEGFNNGTSGTTNDYTYDANGNMTSDKNKAISTISYNHLNLPDFIVFANGNVIEYLYTSTGQKVQKTVREDTASPPVLKEVDYLDGFQYAGAVLQFFPHAEGYVSATPYAASLGAPPTSYAYNYVFNYTDHLGNVRLSYTKDLANNQLKVLEENNYYPFGLKHKVYNTGKMDFEKKESLPGQSIPPVITNVTKTRYDYKFQSQERQDELGLNWDSFKWRNYDYAIGRFMSIDPLAEQYSYQSPYNFSENRVVDGVELEGLEFVPSRDGSGATGNVTVNNNSSYSSDQVTSMLQGASNILSQNGYSVSIQDTQGSVTINLSDTGGLRTLPDGSIGFSNGHVTSEDMGNTINGTVNMTDMGANTFEENVRTLAHEIGHLTGLDHTWAKENGQNKLPNSDPVPNTEENKGNLMNSKQNDVPSLKDASGTNITPEQTNQMKNVIEKNDQFPSYYENK